MRYYDLTITPSFPSSSPPTKSQNASTKESTPTLRFSSYVKAQNGGASYLPGGAPTDVFDPGALDISFQISMADMSEFAGSNGGASITISGIDISTINQAANLQGQTLTLKAGMGNGLPLSNPKQTGTLLSGTIQNSFGNWQGTQMDLTLFVVPHHAASKDPHNTAYTIDCKKDQKVRDAIIRALHPTVQNPQITFTTPQNPIARHDFTGTYRGLKELCVAVGDLWEQTTGKRLVVQLKGKTILCSDAKTARTPIAIAFEELVGQPTWNGTDSITFCCPLRGDLNVNDLISLPTRTNDMGVFSDVKAAPHGPPSRQGSLFSGTFQIKNISHLGQFRSAQAMQWMSSINCTPYTLPTPGKAS